MDRRLERPGAEIAFADTGGTGPPVVLTHGAGLDHTMFEDQAAALRQHGYRLITWDLRGHGQSTMTAGARFAAPDALGDLVSLLRECAVDAPVLVGHSLGGNLVQAFAHRHPHRTRAQVVLGSTWNAGPLSRRELLALRAAAPLLAAVPAARLPALMARASAHTPEAVERCREVFARMPKARFLDVWTATASLLDPGPAPAGDRRSPVPLALVRGERDRTGNIATAMPRWAAAEGVTEHVVPGAGHVLTWDAGEQASRLLLQVLHGWDLLPGRGAGTP